nr:MAG TPA: hypothetical protein [Bacteriophage sp.]
MKYLQNKLLRFLNYQYLSFLKSFLNYSALAETCNLSIAKKC